MGRSGGGRNFGGRSGGGSRGHHSSRPTHTARTVRTGYRPYRSIWGRNLASNKDDDEQQNFLPRKKLAIVWILLVFLLAGAVSFFTISGDLVPDIKSVRERMPLVGQVTETDWYGDNLDWVIHEQVLTDGLKYFYEKTGVQPYVLLLPYDTHFWRGNNIDVDQVDAYLNDYYENHFADEGHFLLAYFASAEDSILDMNGHFYYICGYAAEGIMDDEAIDIFWAYLSYYYDDTSYHLEQMLSHTFTATADGIMSASAHASWDWDTYIKIALILLAVVVAVLLLVILFAFAIGKREQKMLQSGPTVQIENIKDTENKKEDKETKA